jgi:RND family efflux transporter MFP subunit
VTPAIVFVASSSLGVDPETKAMRLLLVITALLPLALAHRADAEEYFTVAPALVTDEKAVFATVESIVSEPARTRIGGTIVALSVREGDHVAQDQIVATVADEKLTLQIKSLDAQIAGLEAQLSQAQTDLARAEDLFGKGIIARTALDQARTAFNVANNGHGSRVAERSVIQEQAAQGNVLAPLPGRVTKVPLRTGTVVLPGESVAIIAQQNFVLRLRVPERHARFLKAGDAIRTDADELGEAAAQFGTITLVYPQIEDGRVIADATLAGLGEYFVGQRIRVWVSGGSRSAIVIPSNYVTTRFGVDYVRMQNGERFIDVPVQRGRDLPRPDILNGLEILSGLAAGDRLVRP